MKDKDKEDQELLEKINKYLDGELSNKEIQAFEADLKADKELAKEVELNRMVNETIKNKEIFHHKNDVLETMEAVKKISDSVHVDFDETGKDRPKKTSSKNGHYLLGIAASVLLLLAAVFLFRQYIFPASLDSLVATYLEDPYPSPPLYRGQEEIIVPWVLSYERGDYQEAKNALEKIVASGDASPEASFYLGLCYLYQGNPDPQNAAKQFNSVLDSDNRYREQALWYLGLSYILNDEKESAAENLRKITGFKKTESQIILEKLE